MVNFIYYFFVKILLCLVENGVGWNEAFEFCFSCLAFFLSGSSTFYWRDSSKQHHHIRHPKTSWPMEQPNRNTLHNNTRSHRRCPTRRHNNSRNRNIHRKHPNKQNHNTKSTRNTNNTTTKPKPTHNHNNRQQNNNNRIHNNQWRLWNTHTSKPMQNNKQQHNQQRTWNLPRLFFR